MGAADYGMLIFGGKEITLELPNPFEQYLSIKRMKHFWGKVGDMPLTRDCLLSLQVRHKIVMNDGAIELTSDPQAKLIAAILAKKNESCDNLCNLGYKGNLFRVKLKIQEESAQPGRLAAEKSSERREVLAKARSTGVHFKVTGGGHLTSDYMLVGYELVERKDKFTKLESQKKDALGVTQINEQAQQVINQLRAEMKVDAIMVNDPSAITNEDLDILLKCKMDSDTLPGVFSKNKRTRVAKLRGGTGSLAPKL